MRVLLDENLPRKLVRLFVADVDVVTVAQRGWRGIKNGTLLRLAEAEFDVFASTDKGIPHQQNVASFSIGMIVLRAWRNRLQDPAPLMERVNEVVWTIQPGEVVVVAHQ